MVKRPLKLNTTGVGVGVGMYDRNNLVKRLKGILEKQFALAEVDAKATFGVGLFNNIIKPEFKKQINKDNLFRYAKLMPIKNLGEVELALSVSMNHPVDEKGNVDINGKAEHTIYFNLKRKAMEIHDTDVELRNMVTKGVEPNMTADEQGLVMNKNIQQVLLNAENVHFLYYYVTKEMMLKAAGSETNKEEIQINE